MDWAESRPVKPALDKIAELVMRLFLQSETGGTALPRLHRRSNATVRGGTNPIFIRKCISHNWREKRILLGMTWHWQLYGLSL
jgi:hypothetical protein